MEEDAWAKTFACLAEQRVRTRLGTLQIMKSASKIALTACGVRC